jgi:hypothetical protein
LRVGFLISLLILNFTHHSEVGFNIPKTEIYARTKHFLRKNSWVLFSAEFSIITSEDDVFIFYLTESIFFHWDVIRDIGEKGLHVFDASVDVSFDLFNLLLKLCLQKGENH